MVTDDKGYLYHNAEVFASIRSAGGEVKFSRVVSDVPLEVLPADTVGLFVNEFYYEFPVAGLDTLFVTIDVPRVTGGTGVDSLNMLEPVVVSARRPRVIHTGVQSISSDTHTGIAYSVPLRRGFRDLRAALDGRVAGVSFSGDELIIRGERALIVVDGSVMRDFADANARVMIDDVESITVHRDAGMATFYSGRTSGTVGGVVVISTNRGFNQRKKR